MPKTPRFTDLQNHRRPYATSAESAREGYLERKFRVLQREQRASEAEIAEKIRPMRKTAK